MPPAHSGPTHSWVEVDGTSWEGLPFRLRITMLVQGAPALAGLHAQDQVLPHKLTEPLLVGQLPGRLPGSGETPEPLLQLPLLRAPHLLHAGLCPFLSLEEAPDTGHSLQMLHLRGSWLVKSSYHVVWVSRAELPGGPRHDLGARSPERAGENLPFTLEDAHLQRWRWRRERDEGQLLVQGNEEIKPTRRSSPSVVYFGANASAPEAPIYQVPCSSFTCSYLSA